MTVTVRFFASYAEVLGQPSLVLDLTNGATVYDVVSHVAGMPGAAGLPPAPLIAVNHSYAKHSAILADGDEVAFIPPVAGG
ncbi:MAG: molybdopterin converting factor subunit 1 [Gemmatimonadales bacterium]